LRFIDIFSALTTELGYTKEPAKAETFMSHIQVYDAKDFEAAPAAALREARSGKSVVEIKKQGEDSVFLIGGNKNHVLRALEEVESLQALEEGLDDIRAGRTRPAGEVFDELRQSIRNR
jgi:hypothetical protein